MAGELDPLTFIFSQVEAEVAEHFSVALVATGEEIESYAPPTHLLPFTTYYWQVISVNDFGETLGDVWHFTTGGGPFAGTYRIGSGRADYATLFPANTLAGRIWD